MTETRKWTVGAALVALLVLVAGWFLLIAPQRSSVADVQAQTEAQSAQNSALQTDIEVLKQQNKELPAKQAELAALQTKIPDTPQLPTYIRELQDLGDKSGVGFVSLTPSAPAVLGGSSDAATPTAGMLTAINVDMVAQGSYFEITKFINELETSSRYTLVGGYSIGEGDQAEDVTAGKTSDLTATINARIYLVPTMPEGVTDPTTSEAGSTSTTTP